MTIEERLEKVEQELSRANRRNRRLFAGVVVGIGLAVVVWVAPKPQTLIAQDAEKTPTSVKEATTAPATAPALNVIRANAFWLEDEQGRLRAALDVDASGPRLTLYDERDQPRVSLGTNKDESGLWKHAKVCRVATIIRPYLETLT